VTRTNLLLSSLSAAEMAALRPHLNRIALKHKAVLFETGELTGQVYFPLGSIVSIVVSLSTGETIEAAMVGSDGAVGITTALNGKPSSSRALVQMPGDALVCGAGALKAAALQSETLLSTLISHEQTVFAQAQQSAACMATHRVEARLCRWLLRACDLSHGNTLRFTQEFLAQMLGVRRTSLTTVANTLQQAGLIKYNRGVAQILDVAALQRIACECYDAVKIQHRNVMGPSSAELESSRAPNAEARQKLFDAG
jgi:CRP-like cAMP-binding protein